jgi:hypothetical protein
MNDNLAVAHPTNEAAMQTGLDSRGPNLNFLDLHSASIRSTVNYHSYLKKIAVAFGNAKQCTILVGTVLTRTLARVVTKTARQK